MPNLTKSLLLWAVCLAACATLPLRTSAAAGGNSLSFDLKTLDKAVSVEDLTDEGVTAKSDEMGIELWCQRLHLDPGDQVLRAETLKGKRVKLTFPGKGLTVECEYLEYNAATQTYSFAGDAKVVKKPEGASAGKAASEGMQMSGGIVVIEQQEDERMSFHIYKSDEPMGRRAVLESSGPETNGSKSVARSGLDSEGGPGDELTSAVGGGSARIAKASAGALLTSVLLLNSMVYATPAIGQDASLAKEASAAPVGLGGDFKLEADEIVFSVVGDDLAALNAIGRVQITSDAEDLTVGCGYLTYHPEEKMLECIPSSGQLVKIVKVGEIDGEGKNLKYYLETRDYVLKGDVRMINPDGTFTLAGDEFSSGASAASVKKKILGNSSAAALQERMAKGIIKTDGAPGDDLAEKFNQMKKSHPNLTDEEVLEILKGPQKAVELTLDNGSKSKKTGSDPQKGLEGRIIKSGDSEMIPDKSNGGGLEMED
jgi:lipopolysaccharide export system protein LptA